VILFPSSCGRISLQREDGFEARLLDSNDDVMAALEVKEYEKAEDELVAIVYASLRCIIRGIALGSCDWMSNKFWTDADAVAR